ncbi:MAG: DUF3124 domain-containing protein [Leptolyngbyaceae cyanobacterium bins.302]|nr:DUF3124 domain-containing protein [Leptolyngbyaceae cyanobacterium bins.302]
MRIVKLAIVLVLSLLLITACTETQTSASSNATTGGEQLQRLRKDEKAVAVVTAPVKISRGQVVYVPAYSHIYHGNGIEQLLTITLSIRNTSLTAPIFLRSIRYYDSSGTQVKQYTQEGLRLAPLATTEFLIPQQDASGGSGANFIVEWVTDQPATDPIIEAVMISTSSQQGIAFTASGQVIQELASSK